MSPIPDPYLTAEEVMAVLRVKDRHTLDRMVAQGRLQRFNFSGGAKQARWKYRLVPMDPEPPQLSMEELHWREIKGRHGL